MKSDTVAAIATPAGRSAIGIVRLTGPDTIKTVSSVCKIREKNTDFTNFTPRTAYTCFISHNNFHIDEAMITLFTAPRSYTGEDMAEISCHGNPYIMFRLMEALLSSGAKAAGPGEFTKRAFMNGKMDLSEAEAVADVIEAGNSASLSVSLAQLNGREKKAVIALKTSITKLLADLELLIDFPDESGQASGSDEIIIPVTELESALGDMIVNAEFGMMLKNGVRAVICGAPNAGKSSVMNALLKKERAIVTHIPGTTRDVIEDTLEINGLPVKLIDTAGLRETSDPAETEGVRRAGLEIENADIVLLVIDGTRPLSTDDKRIAESCRNRPIIIIVNKNDLRTCSSLDDICEQLGLPAGNGMCVSALTGTGIDETAQKAYSLITGGHNSSFNPADVTVANLRHREALINARECVRSALNAINKKMSPEFPAADLRRAADFISGITGEVTSDDLLGLIFGKFCIGK